MVRAPPPVPRPFLRIIWAPSRHLVGDYLRCLHVLMSVSTPTRETVVWGPLNLPMKAMLCLLMQQFHAWLIIFDESEPQQPPGGRQVSCNRWSVHLSRPADEPWAALMTIYSDGIKVSKESTSKLTSIKDIINHVWKCLKLPCQIDHRWQFK